MVEYREIAGFPDYRVGDDGSVWSCRKWVRPAGEKPRGVPDDAWRQLAASRDGRGYPRVILCRYSGKVSRSVHQLVLEAFVGPCPPGMECCHGDDDKTNNVLGNLRWDTPKANGEDRVRNGRIGSRRGERNGNARLTAEQVLAIRREYDAGGVTQRQLAERYGVGRSLVGQILLRQKWAHV